MRALATRWSYSAIISYLLLVTIIGIGSGNALGQTSGNTLSGQVFGLERRPIYDAYVELLDEFWRVTKLTRTNSSGRYFFGGIGPGNYYVKVRPFGTLYEEMEQSIDFVNIPRELPSGERIYSGMENKQLDFYLTLPRGVSTVNAAIFVQDVPPEAKKKFEDAINDLNDKKDAEGLAGLRGAIELFPRYYDALTRLGEEYVRLKHYEAAKILLALAVEINPRSYRGWYGLAYSLNALGDKTNALSSVKKAVEIYNRSAEAYLLYGVLLKGKREFTEAVVQLKQAKELSRNSLAEAHWNLALIYAYELKQYGEAAKELKLFLKAAPEAQDVDKIKQLITDFEQKDRNSK